MLLGCTLSATGVARVCVWVGGGGAALVSYRHNFPVSLVKFLKLKFF